MKLNKFIRRPGKSAQYLAEACDVNLVTAYRWVNGDSIPTPANMARIQKYTRGHVKPADFYTTDDEEEAS